MLSGEGRPVSADGADVGGPDSYRPAFAPSESLSGTFGIGRPPRVKKGPDLCARRPIAP